MGQHDYAFDIKIDSFRILESDSPTISMMYVHYSKKLYTVGCKGIFSISYHK
jgi:hypothetical protein